MKDIMRQYSIARTPQQNRIVERRNRTLIEAARTMLADLKLPTTFWAEAVNTACYVQNRVLVVKPHNKTPYVLFHNRTSMLSFMRPFGSPVTILNTIDHLGKFDGMADEGFFVRYPLNSKSFRVFNSRTRIVKETLHIRFSKNTPNNMGSGPNWLFDIDALTKTMNYQPIVAGTQSNGNAGTKDNNNACQARKEKEPGKYYILLPLWTADLSFLQEPKSSQNAGFKPSNDVGKKVNEVSRQDTKCKDQEENNSVNSTNRVNVIHSTVNDVSNEVNVVGNPYMPELKDISIFEDSNEDVFGAEADLNNLESTFQINHIPTTRIHKDRPLEQFIGDLHSAPQTRRMSKNLEEHGLVSSKWNFSNKFDEKEIVIWNKARLVAQVHTQEKGIAYDEVFAPVARIEAISLFLAYASFKDFVVYQMDVNSDFLYEKIEEEVYVCQPLGFEDPDFSEKVYKVEKALYRLHQDPRAWHKLMLLGKLTTARVNAVPGRFWTTAKFKTVNEEVQIHALVDGMKMRLSIRRGDNLVSATTTASSLEAEQDSGNIDKTQTKTTSNEPSSQGTSLSDGPWCQDTIRDTYAHTRYERVSKMSSDSLLARVNTPQSDEDRLKHIELMKICTTLQKKVLDLEDELNRTRLLNKLRLMERIDEIDADEDIALVSTHDDVSTQDNIVQDEGIEDVGEEEVVEVVTTAKMIIDTVVDAAQVTTAIVDITVTRAPKRKGVMIQEPEETTTTKTASSQQPHVQDKGKEKAKLIEEPEMPKKKNIKLELIKNYLKSKLLKNFDREDLEVLWRLVKDGFVKTKQVDYMGSFLLHTLKTMFEHHVEDNVWKNQQGLAKVMSWKLFDSCGVHCVKVQSIQICLLVEKMYPLTHHTLNQMFNNVKLQVDYECEMAYELLRLVKNSLRKDTKLIEVFG
nr:putative ribonuclease H-like domain-containing protein [Tanacetum cinerariifolium]